MADQSEVVVPPAEPRKLRVETIVPAVWYDPGRLARLLAVVIVAGGVIGWQAKKGYWDWLPGAVSLFHVSIGFGNR